VNALSKRAVTLGWILAVNSGVAVADPVAAADVPREPLERHEANLPALTLEERAMEVMDLLYQGRVTDARAGADAMVDDAPSDALPYLIRARVSRDFISDQNWKRESLKPQNEPVHADLERAIVAADAMLERDPDSTRGYL
jgi:hypothetical protein